MLWKSRDLYEISSALHSHQLLGQKSRRQFSPAVKTIVVVSSQRLLGTSARLSILAPIATSAGVEKKLLPVQLCLFPCLSEAGRGHGGTATLWRLTSREHDMVLLSRESFPRALFKMTKTRAGR